MRIGFRGELLDEPVLRAGFIGCGSHAFRNVYPALSFAPVRLRAVCDLDPARARAFAEHFGVPASYADHRRMLEKENLDAVFIVVGYDPRGRPLYPDLVVDCLQAGCHVWIEKPPAASVAEIDRMESAAAAARRRVMIGFKKMFFPANEKARSLLDDPDFGDPSLFLLQYPQYVPTEEEFAAFRGGGAVPAVTGFLDHLCHPVSLLLLLAGPPESVECERSARGSGVALFRMHSGALASLALTHGAAANGGMERTTVVSDRGRHLVIDNNIRLVLHRNPPPEPATGYGNSPSFFTGSPGETSACWEPEFSLGQLYNKGLFLQGYWAEVNEFARAILEDRPLARAGLRDGRIVTAVFEAFFEGPGRRVCLPRPPDGGASY